MIKIVCDTRVIRVYMYIYHRRYTRIENCRASRRCSRSHEMMRFFMYKCIHVYIYHHFPFFVVVFLLYFIDIFDVSLMRKNRCMYQGVENVYTRTYICQKNMVNYNVNYDCRRCFTGDGRTWRR